ncbi:MAG: hypothetical protein MUD11_00430 [Rhodobacteraceae bacterium]|nr:hypothetical protein [Paracoccaceae bacterium]
MQDSSRANLTLLAVGVVSFVMMGAGASVYGPALPEFQRSFGLTEAAAGFLISAHWVGCGLGVAAMYWKGEAFGPRHALAPMAIGAGLVVLGYGFAVTLLGALIFGAGYGLATAVFNPRIMRAFGPRGGAMLSLLNATFAFGAIAIPLVYVWLGRSIPLTFGLVALIAVACWLTAGLVTREAAPVARAAGRFNPRLGLMTLAVFSIGMEASLIGLGPTALIASGIDEDHAAQLLSLFFVAFLCARIMLVFIADRIPSFTIYLVALLLSAVFAVCAAVIDAGLFFVLMGACVGLFFPGFYVAAARAMGDDPRVSPTIIAAGLVGGIFAPLILAGLMPAFGQTGFFWIVATVTLITAIAGYTLGRPALRQ